MVKCLVMLEEDLGVSVGANNGKRGEFKLPRVIGDDKKPVLCALSPGKGQRISWIAWGVSSLRLIVDEKGVA